MKTFKTFGVNALNGLFSFLLYEYGAVQVSTGMCQRPKRALFISTIKGVYEGLNSIFLCQRPKRALFISTKNLRENLCS